MRLSSLVVGEVSGRSGRKYFFFFLTCINIYSTFTFLFKVHEMVRYAQDYTTCRKIAFEEYFSLDSRQKEGLVNEITPDQACGICDNCTRPTNSVLFENISQQVGTIVRLCNLLRSVNERVTMIKLVQMLQKRGLGVIKSRVEKDENIMIPIDRKYTEYVKVIIF